MMVAILLNIIAIIALTVVLVEDRNTRSESLWKTLLVINLVMLGINIAVRIGW
ncbi:hypothetical protein [Staphylococcus phage PT94]